MIDGTLTIVKQRSEDVKRTFYLKLIKYREDIHFVTSDSGFTTLSRNYNSNFQSTFIPIPSPPVKIFHVKLQKGALKNVITKI